MSNENRFRWEVRPVALKENTVTGEHYRFTVLTDRLIRMEHSTTGIFEDRATQKVFYRDFPACDFKVKREGGLLILDTAKLVLTYVENAEFAAETLSVRLKQEPGSCWHYGDYIEDLGGTVKTLDEVDGEIPVNPGVCSRWGFTVLDDSDSLALDETGWIAAREETVEDLYFFGYGYDYLGSVQALYRLTGAPPMLPAYALGNWWSRYHAYSQQEYLDLMDRFHEEDIPFSVGVVDMDWHVVNIPKEDQDPELPGGWTGYTWNKALFPDYKQFLKELHSRNLRTALNLHPADGVRRHEVMYPEMARAVGIDPDTKERVRLDILSKEYMSHYFDIIHHPYEEDGVDFWWMDWQQGTSYWWIHEANKPGEYRDPRERVDPLWQLNHLHILDISRSGKRPMFFSRYAGPGSHRYPVGFSGDTLITWDSLQFQPQFTAMASNVGYCWWSHDIGGHTMGYRDDELVTRWLQLGVFSPVNRLHSSNSNWVEKEPWAFEGEPGKIMKHWLQLRHRFFPYLYTMNHRAHADLQPLVQPMYYSHPKCSGAYEVPNQFWFGSELIAAPITSKNDPVTSLGAAEAWIPHGDWFDFDSGLHYVSNHGRKMKLCRDLAHMPILAKAGAIVPLAAHVPGDNRLNNSADMEALVFPGADNCFTLYEDAGDGSEYRSGAFAKTKLELNYADEAVFTIHPAQGDLTLIPAERNWTVSLRGFHRDAEVSVFVNDVAAHVTALRLDDSNTTVVKVSAPVDACVTVKLSGHQLMHDNADAQERCRDRIRLSQITYAEKEHLWKQITDPALSLHKRLVRITGRRPEQNMLILALRELMCLTEEEYRSDAYRKQLHGGV